MKWTKTPPTVEGFYWALAERNKGAAFPPAPEIVQVLSGAGSLVYFGCGIGNEGSLDEMELWGDEVLWPPSDLAEGSHG